MIHVKCSNPQCATPYSCIPVPNTYTVISYADNVDLNATKSSRVEVQTSTVAGTGTGAQAQSTAGVNVGPSAQDRDQYGLEPNPRENKKVLSKELMELFIYKQTQKDSEPKPTFTGLLSINHIDCDDYLVIYCDSGHKNYLPFKHKE